MTSQLRKISVLVIASIALAACTGQATPTRTPVPPTDTPAATGVIVISEINDEPAATVEDFQPLADYLGANLAEFGISAGDVKVAPDMETAAQWLESGEVDLFFDSLYPAMIIGDQSGAEPILRRWKDGVGEYHTVFFTRADGDVDSLDDLPGGLVAFDEELSTSGYMVPLAHLLEADFNAVAKADVDATVADDEVGYVFSGDDENTIQWVISGRVAAGVTDSASYEEIPADTREGLTILAETEDVPRQVVVVRPGIDPELLDAIKTLLVELDEADSGAEILEQFDDTAQFDEFPEGAEAALERMREIYGLVQDR